MDKVKFYRYGKYVLAAFLIIIAFLVYKQLFVLLCLTLFGGIWGYVHDKNNKTVFDFRLGFVLGIFVTRHYGLGYAILYYLAVAVIPNILAGGRIDGPTFVFHGLYIALFTIVSLFPGTNIILLGLLMVFTDGILGIFINTALGVPYFVSILAACVAVTMRIIYILTLGGIIEYIFEII